MWTFELTTWGWSGILIVKLIWSSLVYKTTLHQGFYIYIYIYECKTRGHGNTEQKREAANIARSKNSKTLLIAYVFLVSVNTPICAVHTSRYYIISMYMLTNAYTSNNNHHFCHKYLSEWWQEEEEETPSQRNRGQVELQNRRSW